MFTIPVKVTTIANLCSIAATTNLEEFHIQVHRRALEDFAGEYELHQAPLIRFLSQIETTAHQSYDNGVFKTVMQGFSKRRHEQWSNESLQKIKRSSGVQNLDKFSFAIFRYPDSTATSKMSQKIKIMDALLQNHDENQ